MASVCGSLNRLPYPANPPCPTPCAHSTWTSALVSHKTGVPLCHGGALGKLQCKARAVESPVATKCRSPTAVQRAPPSHRALMGRNCLQLTSLLCGRRAQCRMLPLASLQTMVGATHGGSVLQMGRSARNAFNSMSWSLQATPSTSSTITNPTNTKRWLSSPDSQSPFTRPPRGPTPRVLNGPGYQSLLVVSAIKASVARG